LYEQPSDFELSTIVFTGGPDPSCFVAGALLSSLPLLGGTNVCLNGNIFAAVFEQNGSLTANTSTLQHSLAHETGHVVDAEWGGATGTNPNKLLSGQPGFQAAYTADTNAIKLLPACTFNYFVQLPPGQSGPPAPNFAGGFFSEQYDDNLHLICNDPQITNPQPNQMPPGQLNSPYVAPNSNVIQQAWMDNGFWPEVFTPQPNILPYKELFAEMFAAMTGYTDTANVPNQGGADPGLDSSFACSSAWTGLAFADNLPVPAQNFLEYVIPVGSADKTSGFYSNVKYLGCDNTYTKPPPYKFDLPR
jgi:hypothetical protein